MPNTTATVIAKTPASSRSIIFPLGLPVFLPFHGFCIFLQEAQIIYHQISTRRQCHGDLKRCPNCLPEGRVEGIDAAKQRVIEVHEAIEEEAQAEKMNTKSEKHEAEVPKVLESELEPRNQQMHEADFNDKTEFIDDAELIEEDASFIATDEPLKETATRLQDSFLSAALGEAQNITLAQLTQPLKLVPICNPSKLMNLTASDIPEFQDETPFDGSMLTTTSTPEERQPPCRKLIGQNPLPEWGSDDARSITQQRSQTVEKVKERPEDQEDGWEEEQEPSATIGFLGRYLVSKPQELISNGTENFQNGSFVDVSGLLDTPADTEASPLVSKGVTTLNKLKVSRTKSSKSVGFIRSGRSIIESCEKPITSSADPPVEPSKQFPHQFEAKDGTYDWEDDRSNMSEDVDESERVGIAQAPDNSAHPEIPEELADLPPVPQHKCQQDDIPNYPMCSADSAAGAGHINDGEEPPRLQDDAQLHKAEAAEGPNSQDDSESKQLRESSQTQALAQNATRSSPFEVLELGVPARILPILPQTPLQRQSGPVHSVQGFAKTFVGENASPSPFIFHDDFETEIDSQPWEENSSTILQSIEGNAQRLEHAAPIKKPKRVLTDEQRLQQNRRKREQRYRKRETAHLKTCSAVTSFSEVPTIDPEPSQEIRAFQSLNPKQSASNFSNAEDECQSTGSIIGGPSMEAEPVGNGKFDGKVRLPPAATNNFPVHVQEALERAFHQLEKQAPVPDARVKLPDQQKKTRKPKKQVHFAIPLVNTSQTRTQSGHVSQVSLSPVIDTKISAPSVMPYDLFAWQYESCLQDWHQYRHGRQYVGQLSARDLAPLRGHFIPNATFQTSTTTQKLGVECGRVESRPCKNMCLGDFRSADIEDVRRHASQFQKSVESRAKVQTVDSWGKRFSAKQKIPAPIVDKTGQMEEEEQREALRQRQTSKLIRSSATNPIIFPRSNQEDPSPVTYPNLTMQPPYQSAPQKRSSGSNLTSPGSLILREQRQKPVVEEFEIPRFPANTFEKEVSKLHAYDLGKLAQSITLEKQLKQVRPRRRSFGDCQSLNAERYEDLMDQQERSHENCAPAEYCWTCKTFMDRVVRKAEYDLTSAVSLPAVG